MMRLVVASRVVCGLMLCAGASGQDARSTALEVKGKGQKTFYADSRVGNNQVTFFSESTLEDFTGVCNQVAGQCELDPAHVEALKGRFVVKVEDMKTGIELRDEHMRGAEWLDAAKHPEIVIEILRAEEVKKTAADTASLTLVTRCSLHGQTRELRIPGTLRYLDETPETLRRVKGDLIRIRAEFDVKLSDFAITGPKGSDFIGLKVGDTIRVKVTVFGSTEKPPEALQGDKPADTLTPPPRPGKP